MDRLLFHGASAHPNTQSRSPRAREPDIYARIRYFEFVLSQPGFHHYGSVPASAQGNEQRPIGSEGNEQGRVSEIGRISRRPRNHESTPGGGAHVAASVGGSRICKFTN